MRHFDTYASLQAALDPPVSEPLHFRFLPEYKGTFRCRTCGEINPLQTTGGGTGFAVFEDSGIEQFRCYACCADYDRQDMIDTGKATLYLLMHDPNRYEVTNWPGSLRFKALSHYHSHRGGGFGSQRTDAWFAGPDGYLWHAVNRGDSQIARCKRTKQRV